MKFEIAFYVLAALVLLGVGTRTALDIMAINRFSTVEVHELRQHKVCVHKAHNRLACHFEY